MRKPLPSAKLLNLPEEQQAALADWLLGGMPYHEARKLVEKEFGVSTSLAALSHFFQEVCVPALVARRRQAVSTADEVAKAAEAEPGQFDAATVDAIKQKAFELAISPASKPKDVKALFMLLQKARDQEHAGRKLDIERTQKERDQELKAQELALAQNRFRRDTCELFLQWSADQRARDIAARGGNRSDQIEALGQLMFGDSWKEEKAA